ncbi:hypothetical protein CHS0354_002916 [Potamilus streckersoni]|uniref:Uncharacterized protein n=1 Tax=Potamilus streckersoni TaxID=2493646 RepID=A0AAE0WAC7_9BIVA|nr:hypothetical protein CHS0354_002916 [Potamilus streckersoni]
MINVTEHKQQASTFTVQQVHKELVDAFHFMAGMVPFLQKLTDKNEKKKLDAIMAFKASMALKEMKNFMVKDGEPLKSRQKLMRNLKIVDLIVNLLKIPIKGPDQEYLWKLFMDVYDALSTCLLGHSPKNKLYIARYIDTFIKQFDIKERKIGQNAVHMVTEIIRDNRKIVDRITHDHIDLFVDLLHTEKHYCYLDLLMVLCICDGVSITENQKYITDVWLTKGSRGSVFFTQFGESIGYETGVVYVSTDGRSWDELKDFAEENKDKDEYLFLEHQLELFGFLCDGHNKESIEAITQQLNYLSWEGAFVCLKNEELPDLLRARYCDLIIKMFVDISENHSQVGQVQLSYIYKDLDKEENEVDNSSLSETYTQLRDWSFEFLEHNCSIVASNIGKNMLTKQVLKLLHYLVSFGFYSKSSDIEKLVEPLMRLLDSRDNVTSQNSKGIEARDGVQITSMEAQESEQNSQTKERFQKSTQAKAVVEARLQAMEVLDLVFDVIFKQRLQKFIGLFREVYDKARNHQGVPGLECLMEEPFDLDINRDVASTALRQLDEIFEETSLLKPSVVEIFLDLSRYDYDDMVRKSMHLLNRYYSAHSGLFKKALQSQVLVSDSSVKAFKSMNKRLRVLRQLSTLKLADAEARKLCDILDNFIHMCHLQGDEGEPHRMNQNILYHNGVLEDTLTILSQEIDNQHAGLQRVFQKTFTLLKMMACGNVTVQVHLFNHLDLLLSKAAGVQEMAEALTEVFIGNHSACLKIMQHQVQKMMLLLSEHKSSAPQFLDLLHAVVKCDKLDFPIKRNQDLVMTYFVQFRADVAYVIENDESDRQAILTSSQHPDLIYLISFVDLLAACAEGQNKFTESVCQTVFKISELLKILNNPSISDNWKRPFLCFFLWVYLNTTSERNESWAFDISHDNTIWDFLDSLNGTLQNVTEYARNNGDVVKQLLKKPRGKSDQSTDQQDKVRGSLHYLFDAVMPFLKVFCKTYYQHDVAKFPKEPECMDALAHNFKTFLEVIRPLISIESQMKTLTNCLRTLVSSTTLSAEEKKAFQDLIDDKVQCQDVCSKSRKIYEDFYKEEEEVNSKLKVFVMNMKTAFGGVNDVRTQIGFRSKEPYSKIGSDEELPLGVEFQEHLKCFVDPDEKDFRDKYQMAKGLVLQLQHSMTLTHLNEKEKQEEVELNVKCFQLLRGLIHNEIAKLPPDFRSHVNASSRQLKVIKDVQNALNSFDTIQSVLKHMSSPHDKICQELLAFLAALLFNGNEEVQKSMLDYFTGSREDTFMFAIKDRMSLSVIATTGRCVLHALHRAKVEAQMTTREVSGASDQPIRQNSHLPPRHRTFSGSELHSLTGIFLRLRTNSINKVNPKPEVDIGLQEMGQSNGETQMSQTIIPGLELKDDGYIELVFKILRLMCNQQYRGLQDLLREQPDSINSVNLVSDTTQFLSILYSNVNDKSVELISQLFDTLVRMTSGNLINQALVFDKKICDYITHILRVGDYKDCSTRDIYNLKRSIGSLLKSLTEENPKVKEGEANAELPKELMECIDTDILVTVMVEAYNDLKRKEKEFKENQNLVSEVGFLYFHIIKRKMDLKKDLTLKALIKKDEDNVVWDYFEKNTMSIEVLKEDVLQKLYFRVKKKNMLRKEIKEKFKYEVDRSSPSNKLKDFMDWSSEIIMDIKYRKRIHANLMKRLLVKMWLPMNYMVMMVTMAIVLFILITYQASSVGTPSFLPSYRYPDVYSVIFGLGGLHNFLSVCIFLTFIITNWPTFTPSGELPQLFLVPINFIVNMVIIVWNIRSRLTGSERKPLSPWYQKKPKSHLEVKAYGFKTIYYVIFLACSVAGTATYGYFFAFHLLHLCELNQRLKRVLKAVTTNGCSLLMVAILGLAFFYIYALILFVSYRGWIWKESDGRHCTTVYQCFVSIIHHGFVGGPYTTFEQYMTNMTSNFDTAVTIAVFNVSFFIIITIIGLYLILGIIIDTFSQLRDSKWEIDKDMQNTCFICSRKSQDFERHRGGFERHVKMEHNQWAYLFFFIHLDETQTDDYSALEFSIYKQLLENNLDFFPLNRSLSLENAVDIKEQRSWKDKSWSS